MRLADKLEQRRKAKQKSFVAYLTAGDPDLRATARFVQALARAGADVIELGVPHSDPVADGPTNLMAAERALKSGTSLSGILEMVAALRREGEDVPLVLFTYYNPVLQMGIERFAERAVVAGVDAVLVVDLPPEESEDYRTILRKAGLGTVFLASPTTRPERLALIEEASTAFVYYVSRTGVTGAREQLSASLGTELALIRRHIAKPICIGFGLSTPEQVKEASALADGVVVGSALVKCIEGATSVDDAVEKLEAFTSRCIALLN